MQYVLAEVKTITTTLSDPQDLVICLVPAKPYLFIKPNRFSLGYMYCGGRMSALTAKCKGLTGRLLSPSPRQLKDISKSWEGGGENESWI